MHNKVKILIPDLNVRDNRLATLPDNFAQKINLFTY